MLPTPTPHPHGPRRFAFPEPPMKANRPGVRARVPAEQQGAGDSPPSQCGADGVLGSARELAEGTYNCRTGRQPQPTDVVLTVEG